MKIAIIVDRFPVLSGTFILNQITGLIDFGHEIDIYAREKGSTDKVHQDVYRYGLMEKVYCFTQAGNLFSRILRGARLWMHFITKKYDVVYCHFGPNGNIGVALKKLKCIKRVVTVFHGYDLSMFLNENGSASYDRLFKEGDLFLPISHSWKNMLVKLGCPKDRIVVHHMGINIEKFVQEGFRKDMKFINIVSVGRLSEKKGLEYAVRAVAEVMKRHKSVKYQIVGEGPLKNKLQDLIMSFVVQEHITLLGALEDHEVRELLKSAHIFLLPSVTAENGDMEGIPVALMEAMAAGLPVISTYHSGIPELVIDGESGYLVPERDVDKLVEKLDCLISCPDQWSHLGSRGRAIVENEFNIKKLNKELEKILLNESDTKSL
jgi:colanic acid/amylovoran biosynthesis glycosyltransferase